MDLETEKFTYYLDECYFHPERDKEFSTETEKQLARKAMELLWNKPNISLPISVRQNTQKGNAAESIILYA